MSVELGHMLDSLGWAILHSLWQCSLAALAVIIFRALTRDSQATLRYGFQIFALIGCLVAFTLTFTAYQLQPAVSGSVADGGSALTTITALFGDKDLSQSTLTSESLAATLTPFAPLLGIFWCLGFVALAIRYFGAFAITQHLRKTGLSDVPAHWARRFETLVLNSGIRRQVNVYISNRVTSPLTLGFFKPIVLVPASFFSGLPSEQVEAILLHEIAHIRRHDYLINLFQTVIRTVFFFHPAVYFISRAIDNDREHACDDFAVALTKNPKALARGLVALRLETVQNRFVLSADNGNTPLMARLNRLGYGRISRRRPEHVIASVGTLALAAALIPVTSPLADAGLIMPEIEVQNASHPSADQGNYRFEKVTKNGQQFTAKIDDDGSRWINVAGSWYDADVCPDKIAEILAVPKAPVPPAANSGKEKQKQFDVDQDFYQARVALETVTTAALDMTPSQHNRSTYNVIQLENDMQGLRQKRQAAFLKTHQSREALSRMSTVSTALRPSLTAAAYSPETVASWTSDNPKTSYEHSKQTPGVYIDGKHSDIDDAADWMDDFVTEIVKIETDHALQIISHDAAENARELAEERLEQQIEKAQSAREQAQEAREHALEQANEQRERAIERTERKRERALERAERKRERAEEARERAQERKHSAHSRKYQDFNTAMLKQLKNDGLIEQGANSVTITYPNKKMVVNNVSVPDSVANNYCEILESYNIQKRNDAKIKISPNAFSYFSTSHNSSHVIDEEFGIDREAALSHPSNSLRWTASKPEMPAAPAMPVAAQVWVSPTTAKPTITYHFQEKLKEIPHKSQPVKTPSLVWSSNERHTSVGQRNAHLSPK